MEPKKQHSAKYVSVNVLAKLNLSMNKLPILLFIGLIAVYACLSFDGLHFYDDVGYLKTAISLKNKDLATVLNTSHEQAHRFGFLLPLAFLHNFLPFHEFTHILWNVLVSIFGVLLLYFWLEKYQKNWGLLAALLLGLDYYYLYLCNKIYPDTQAAVLCFLAVLIVWEQTKPKQIWLAQVKNQITLPFKIIHIAWALLAVACLFVAFITKLTSIFIFPFLFFYFLYLALNHKFFSLQVNFVCYFLLFSFLVIFGYFIVYQYFTNDFLFCFHAIETNRYADALSYFDKSFDKIIVRLTYEPVLMFMKAGYFVNFCFALPVILHSWKNLEKNENTRLFLNFWTFALLSMLLFYWFGSTSLAVYSPIPLDYRMFVVISPFLAVVALFGLLRSFHAVSYQLIYSISFGIGAMISCFVLHSQNWLIYFLLSALFSVFYIKNYFFAAKQKYRQKQKVQIFLCVALFFILAIHPFYTLLHSSSANYWAEKQVIRQHLPAMTDKNTSIEVFADSRLAASYDFYYAFQPPKNIHFFTFNHLASSNKKANTLQYILLNYQTINYLQSYTGNDFSQFLFEVSQNRQYEKMIEKDKVVLYKIK